MESTGGLRPGTSEGSKELHEDHAIRAPLVPKLLVDTQEKVPDHFIVESPGGQRLKGFGDFAFLEQQVQSINGVSPESRTDIALCVDSGACGTVMPLRLLELISVVPSPQS